MKTFTLGAGLVALVCASILNAASGDAMQNWGQWRGPLATGFAPEADPPIEWSDTRNVKWKAAIPGSSSSTPIIWGDRVFVLTAVKTSSPAESKEVKASPADAKRDEPQPATGGRPGRGPGGPGGGRGSRGEKPTDVYQFVVLCLDRATGKTRWQKTAREEVPHEGIQPNNSYASASAITDGEVVLAFFGSRGLFCYDPDGNLKWSKDLGRMQTRNGFGEGASPALYGNTIIVNWDDETENDFIAAFDKRDGKQLWKVPRKEDTGWSTPLIVEQGNKPQVVVNATGKVRSYDLQTGKEIWSCAGQTPNAIPSPVADSETVYVTSGFRGAACYAIRLTASGDINGTDAIRWTHNKGTPYVPSPLLVDGLLYFVAGNNGILTCLNTTNGEANYEQERLEDVREVYASPVAAKDRVYVLSRDGKCLVLNKGPKLQVIATNRIEDNTDASMALVGKEIFIHGKQNLYCIGAR